jgi:hypothetical protein
MFDLQKFMEELIPSYGLRVDWLGTVPEDLIDNPIAANGIAQIIFQLPEDEELTDTEIFIVKHIIETLKIADEIRMKQKRCPLAQEYHDLPSKRIH